MGEPQSFGSKRSLLTIRRQKTVVLLLCVCALVLLGRWIAAGGPWGRLLNVDSSPLRPVRTQVDLNTAAWWELVNLPGVSETTARRIVESRRVHGPFHVAEDLLRISGIGPKTLARLRPFVCAGKLEER